VSSREELETFSPVEMLCEGRPFVRMLALVPRCPPEQPNTIIRTVAPISRFAKKTKISALTFLSTIVSCPRPHCHGMLHHARQAAILPLHHNRSAFVPLHHAHRPSRSFYSA
jgi:hypothetical protein